MTAPALLTVDEAATHLRVARSTLYKLFGAGKLPKRKIEGRTFVSEADLAALVDLSAVTVAPPRSKGARKRPAPDVIEFFRHGVPQ